MKFDRFRLVFLVLCAAFAAAAPRAAAQTGWLRIESKNFQLVGDADERELRETAARLEQFRHTLTQLFPQMNFNSPIPTRVVVFRDKKTFDDFKTIEWAAGYFQPGDDINYIVLTADKSNADSLATIFHEYTHFLIDNSLGRTSIPPWFNEGIAEYYERFTIENDQKITLGAVNNSHLQLLRQNRFIPLDVFFATDYYTLHKQSKQNAQLFYAQAWSLVHYLLQGDGGARRGQFNKFVELLIAGTKPKDAFQRAFETDYAAMETELRKYVARAAFTATVFNSKEKLVFDHQMQTFPVSSAEAKAYQGDLLYHTRRDDEAEKILAQALALDANSSLANRALGMVKLRQKKYVDARNFLEKAVQADAQNYLAFFSLAYAVSREGTTEYGFATNYSPADAEKMRENLRRAMALNPNFAESYNLFAFVNIIRNEQIDESVTQIKKALAIAPGNQWYAMRLAELYMRKEDFAAAREIVVKILQTASTDELKIYAENTLKNVNSLEAQLADLKNQERRAAREEVTDEPMSDEEIARRRAKAMLESLNETLRFPRRGEKRLLGFVTKIECQPNQIIYSILADNQMYLLKADSFETVTLISFEPALVNAEIGCGEIKKENLSVVTFRPSASDKSKIAGEIVAIEFVPKNFRFLNERSQ